jgi:hypothetical protein
MPHFLPDTSCLVAGLCAWHEHHERAAREIERRLDRGESLVVAVADLAPSCNRIQVAGAVRRCKQLVGDILGMQLVQRRSGAVCQNCSLVV